MNHDCGPFDFAAWLPAYGLVGSLFLAGVIGSASHCIGMCSPFVLAQVANRVDDGGAPMSEWRRLRAAALLPYHLGRTTSYAAMGAAAAAISYVFVGWTGFRWVAGGLLALGGILFLLMALDRLAGFSLPISRRAMCGITRLVRPLAADPRGIKGYLLGVALGFLPCGLVYAALAIAGGTGDPVLGALGMAGFAIGTAPILMIAGFAGAALAQRWRGILRRATGPLLAVNAVLMLLFAAQMAGI